MIVTKVIKESKANIDGIAIPTNIAELIGSNFLDVECGTTGHQGGDSQHGCRTYFRLTDRHKTDIRIRHNAQDWTNEPTQIEIAFGGDSELDIFIAALEFAADTLRKQTRTKNTFWQKIKKLF